MQPGQLDNAIHRPDAPRHFMVLQPVERLVVVRAGETELLRSRSALRLVEFGRSLYAPVLYFPKPDLKIALTVESRSTHCPLKGDATYYSLPAVDGREAISEIAWSYEKPLPFSQAIEDLIAFYPNKVTIEEHPLS